MFNVYRDNVKLNNTPLTGATNYIDSLGTTSNSYCIGIINPVTSQETSRSSQVQPWSDIYKTLQLDRPTGQSSTSVTYTPNDCSVGDLDGDGEYEIVVKWYPSNALDNSLNGYTDKIFLDAYKLNGTKLWRVDLGKNIRAGAHYTQFLVYDFDGDGKAEVVCQTAPGTIDGKGNYVLMGSDSPTADYRTSKGHIITGPEYLTLFDGMTGANKSTVAYQPARGDVNSWTANNIPVENVSNRFLAGVAYLDGVRPSIVMARGYYFKAALAAYDYVGGRLQQRWLYEVGPDKAGTEAYGQGNHHLSIADVDNDGYDEIIYGGAVIDHNGTFKASSNLGHGDALHVTDIDPDRPGYEVFKVAEDLGKYSHALYDPNNGNILWHSTVNTTDNGRGMAADIDSTHRGLECWSPEINGVYDCKGNLISNTKPSTIGGDGNYNFRIYWDGDLQDELLDKASIMKWDLTTGGTTQIFNLYDYANSAFTNGTKSNPCLSADILGDWREEVIAYNSVDPSQLVIFTTTTPTNHRLYTLMHDPVYRLGVAWQNVGYNQPPHLGFYIGSGLDSIPYPNMFTQMDSVPRLINVNGLKYAISDAWNLYNNAPKGTNTLQYSAEAFTSFYSVIVAAQKYLDGVNLSLTENQARASVDSTLNTLTAATNAFKAKQILVYVIPDVTEYYNIYSYGTADNGASAATTDMTKKFLTAAGNNLNYQTGTADVNEVNLSDPNRTDSTTHWQLTASAKKAGYYTIKSRSNGKYIQANGTLSDTPADIFIAYKKTDNTKLAFSLNQSDSVETCLQVGTSPSITATTYADRVRMRWVIEIAPDPVPVIDTTSFVDIGYDWSGSALVLSTSAITFGSSTSATSFVVNSGKSSEVNISLKNNSGKSILGYDNKSVYKNTTASSIAYIPIKTDTTDYLEITAKSSKNIQKIKINGTSGVLTGGTKAAILYSSYTPFNESFIIGTDSLVLATCRAGNTGVSFESSIPAGTKSFRIYKGIPLTKSGSAYVINETSGKVLGGGEQPRIAYISLTLKNDLINSIISTSTSPKVIVSTYSFDIFGRKIPNNSKGLVIQLIRYSDGSQDCKKVFMR